MADKYGIIGYPLGHSFSPGYFSEKFAREGIDAVYERYELQNITTLPDIIGANPELRGLNVTIPHKKSVIGLLDEADEAAQHCGAVNCIRISSGKLTGYNTDVIGCKNSLRPLLQVQHKQALILGTGGSSNAVAYTLQNLGIPFVKVSRTKAAGVLTYEDVGTEMIAQCKLIINTTPLGMHPDTNSAPNIPYEAVTRHHLLYDLIYNPEETLFLAKGRKQDAVVKNGLEMLHLQAEASWQIWNR